MMKILAATGLTFLITRSKFFQWLREWASAKSELFGYLFSCGQCIGFWVGLVIGLLELTVKESFYQGFIVSGICYFMSLIADKLKL